jgi:ABC-type Fe3+ transport system permease subunit
VSAQPASRISRLLAAGYFLAVVLPPIGFGVGVLLVNGSDKRMIRHGLQIIALAVVAAFALFVILIVSTHSTTGEGGG